MICRGEAERVIRDALLDRAPDSADRVAASLEAARCVDRIYGVLGAGSVNPRYGPVPAGWEAD